MKRIRLVFAVLLMLVCDIIANAQIVKYPVVNVYKNGEVTARFLPAQVDSIVYESIDVDMSVDRTVYYDTYPNNFTKPWLKFEDVLFDVSKVTLEGELWNKYSAYVHRVPDDLPDDGITMKIPFEVFVRGLGGQCTTVGKSKEVVPGVHWVCVHPGNVIIVFTNK